MIKAKKSLGQHFLADQTARATIIATANLKAGETALEIGPGEGFLTAALLETGATVIAVEKDDRLINLLTEKFTEAIKNKKLELIHADILDFLKAKSYKLKANYKLTANIPYYLTGQIIRHFLSTPNQPQSMTLMLQKEVAQRIVAKNSKESLLSISVKAYGAPHYLRAVPRGAFRPTPKVDSAIILIDKINKNNFREISEEKFFVLVKQGFDQKRKMLRAKLGLTTEELASCGVNPKDRAENLTVDQWLCLSKQKSVPHP